MEKILIVDDENDIAELISDILEDEGYETVIANDGKTAINLVREENFDLILLDVMMPDISGTEVCASIRNETSCPIIFVTAKTNLTSKLVGFEVGADDYITKPFVNEELIARVKAHLRRESRENHDYLFSEDGNIKFDLSAKKLLVCEKEIPLTHSEYKICELLIQNRGHVFSREKIYERVFGFYGESADNTIVVHVKNIRVKLSEAGVNPIQTVWGIGYKWE